MVNNPYPLCLLQLTLVCYFTTETTLGFNLERLKNEKGDDQKTEAGNNTNCITSYGFGLRSSGFMSRLSLFKAFRTHFA